MVRMRLMRTVGPVLASWLVRALRRTMRWTAIDEDVVLSLGRAGKPYVHAFFHDQLLMMTYSYRGGSFGRRLAVLASQHRDGEYVARTLERFGHILVRGSSGRGAVSGLRCMVRHLRDGHDAAFAVDGPRGPRHRVQAGAIEAGRLAGAPIVPVAFAASKKKASVPGTRSRSRGRSQKACSSMASRSRCRATPSVIRSRLSGAALKRRSRVSPRGPGR